MDTAPRQTTLVVRIAWLATFVVPLILATLLLGAKAAHSEPAPTPLALEEPEAEEGEYEETECDIAWEEFDEGLLTESDVEELCEEEEAGKSKTKKGGKGSAAPEECVLRSAHGHAAVDERSNKLKLTIGYTAYEPVGAKVTVGKIATVKRQLGRSGVLRLVKNLGKQDPERLVINIKLPSVKKAGCPSRRLVLFPK